MNRNPCLSSIDLRFARLHTHIIMPKSAVSTKEPAFETALAELEAIVSRMEDGQMSLEESLQSYRRGTELIRSCQARLADAQQQVRVLEQDLLKPFAEDKIES